MSKIEVGDKVRYTGTMTPDWDGLEGEVVYISGNRDSCAVRVSKEDAERLKFNGWDYYPYVANLTVIEDEPVAETSAVNHPSHYGGDTTYEVIKVAEAWGLDEDAYLFNVLKYIARAGKKDPATRKQDLEKGRFYIDRRIGTL